MKFKGTIVTSLIFLALAAFVYLYDIRSEPGRLQARDEKDRIYLFDEEDVTRVELVRHDTSYVFVRSESGWEIKEPVGYKGDAVSIEGLVTAFKMAKNEGTVAENTDDPEKFGFGRDTAKLSVYLSDGGIYSVEVGGRNPSETYAYAKIPDSPALFLTSTPLYDRVNNPLYSFRDKTILDFDKSAVSEIRMFQKGARITLERAGDTEWKLTGPIDDRADEHIVELMLNRLSTQKIQKFLNEQPPDLGKYALQDPQYRAELIFDSGDPKKVLYFGSMVKGNFYVRDNEKSVVYEVDTSTVKLFKPELFDLRSKVVSTFDKDSVDVFELTYPDARYLFTREDSTRLWYMTYPSYIKANSQKINSMINDIYWLRVDAFIDDMGDNLKEYGLNPPEADMVLKSHGKVIQHVQLGKRIGKHRYYYNKTNRRLYEVRLSIKPRLVVPRDQLLETKKK